MAEFYRVKIGDLFLSKDGLVGGMPCLLQITNVEDLLISVIGSVTPSITGEPIFQSFPWTKGKAFEIRQEIVLQPVWNDLKDMIADSLENGTSFAVEGTGDIGNFAVNARFNPQRPFSVEGFYDGRIKGAILRLITV